MDRFTIGFLICVVALPWPGWVVGVAFGLLLSLPSAIATKACPLILGLGAIGGIIIGVVRAKFGP